MIAMADSFQTTSYFSASPASNWGGVKPFVATPVRFKNREFSSASSALEAYIDEFQGKSVHKNNQKYKRDLDELLLTSRSNLELSQRPHRSLDVSDRFDQEKWDRMRDLVERSYDQLKLQASMESAKESLSASMMLKQKLQENSRNLRSNESWSAQEDSYSYKRPTKRQSQNSPFKSTDFRSNSDSEIRALRLHTQSNGISSRSGMDLATSVPNISSGHFSSNGYDSSVRLQDRSTHGVLTTANGMDLITRERSSYPKLYRHTINGHVTFEDEEATGHMSSVEANLAARRRAAETTPIKSKSQPGNLHSFSSLDRSKLFPSHLTASQEPSPILGESLNVTDLTTTPSKQTRFNPRTKTQEPTYFERSELSRSQRQSLLEHKSNHRKSHKTNHRYIDLDKASLTTDDLLMAAPGGSNVISKGRSKSVNDVSKLTPVSENSPKRSSKGHYQKENYTAVAHNFSRSGSLGLLGSPNSSRMNSPRSKYQTDNQSSNNNQNNYMDTDSTLGYHEKKPEHSERRKAFVKNLIQEVDCSASSVITAPTLDELQYMPGKKTTTVSQSKLKETPSHSKPHTSKSSHSLSHYSPETDELLIEPALPYIDVSPTSLGTSYVQDLTQGDTQDEEEFQFSFSSRLQKLLSTPLSPPDLDKSSKEITSPDTERILNEERPWEKTKSSYKPPKYITTQSSPARGHTMVDCFVKDCMKTPEKTPKAVESNSRLSGREQPGSMEALKNMLFTVQSMTADDMDDISRISEVTDNEFGEAGSDALGKAMLHLDRMKDLMQK